jgi:hypothetical protein
MLGYRVDKVPNAGNFQEYTYECEWLECYWKQVHNTVHLVTAFYYPWLNLKFS